MSLRRKQGLTLALLFLGYCACYFCRADLAVATPLLVDELVASGASRADAVLRLGQVASIGTLAYALGKMFLTGLGDWWGGRRNFLIGLGGATFFSALFALGGGFPLFTLAWIGNRLTQSIAWSGLLKVSSRWFDFRSYGTVVGFLSVSYLVGDAVARQWMASLLASGHGWRSLFWLGAAAAGLMFAANLLWLRESRVDAGFIPAEANPANLYGSNEDAPARLRDLLQPLLQSRVFLVVCALSLGCTIVRETFNNWTPFFLHEELDFSMARAASASALFPAVGAVSVLACGWMSDRLGPNSRSALLAVGLACTVGSLLTLRIVDAAAWPSWMPLTAISMTAFCLLGPYS
jgi:sugar phosphate permease